MMKRIFFSITLALAMMSVISQIAFADAISLSQTVQAGQNTRFQFELTNETQSLHTYHLSTTGISVDMTESFKQKSANVETIDIDPKTSVEIILQIDVPRNSKIGVYSGVIQALREDDTKLEMPYMLNVENPYSLNIASQPLNISTFRGKTFNIDLTAQNTGAAPVHDLSIQLGTPPKWAVTSTPKKVDQLDPGKSIDFHVEVVVPSSQVSIDQPVTLTLNSIETTSIDQTVNVRVQDNPTGMITTVVGVIAAAIGVWVYFKMRGRR